MTPGSAPAARFDPALVRRDYRDAGQGLLDVAELANRRLRTRRRGAAWAPAGRADLPGGYTVL